MPIRTALTALALAAALPATAAAASPPPFHNRALWRMDEQRGSVMHDAVAAHDGQLRHVRVGVAGWQGRAYAFNGRSSYVMVPDGRALRPGTRGVRIRLRVRITAAPRRGHDYDLLRKGRGSSPGMYKAEIWSDGSVTCRFKGSRHDARLHAGPNLADGHWHTITCSKRRGRITLDVDRHVWTTRVRVGSIKNRSQVVLGAVPGSDWLYGRLDAVSIATT